MEVWNSFMKMFVDADACPVKEIILREASKYGIEVFLVHSTCHYSKKNEYEKAHDITVDNESQAADMAIMNRTQKGDIVVTGDFGLAALILGKGAYGISFNGKIYRNDNIESMLFERHLSATIRRSGGRVKGPAKRNKADDIYFQQNLNILINRVMQDI